jgi:aryl-alcohol dehydrogenase-like predicted oxidoreductase
MRYKILGRSGLRVSEISLGAMTFGEEWGFGASKDESRSVFNSYAEAGGNFIDTANKYTNGTSERLVGEFLQEDRDRFVLATKYSLSTRERDPNASGNHRKNLVQSLEASLGRLRVDYVDLLWLHAWDHTTPAAEVMRALDDLIRAGKVLHIGISDAPAWVVAQSNTIAELRGWTQFTALQIEYSLIERTVERELLPMARSFGLAITPWAALAGGLLTGKFTRATTSEADTKRAAWNERRMTESNLRIAKAVDAVADELGHSSAQVAINWVRQQPGNIIPILGARTAEQLRQSLGCLDFEIPPEQLARLDEVSAVPLGFPYDFLNRERTQEILYGDLADRIDRPKP